MVTKKINNNKKKMLKTCKKPKFCVYFVPKKMASCLPLMNKKFIPCGSLGLVSALIVTGSFETVSYSYYYDFV